MKMLDTSELELRSRAAWHRRAPGVLMAAGSVAVAAAYAWQLRGPDQA